MGSIRENPPIMVLEEETPDTMTFRFRGRRWAVATLVPGLLLVGTAAKLHLAGNRQTALLAVLGIFGLLLVYSTVYSLTADQWLAVDGRRRTVRFRKKNLYGLVEWERKGSELLEVRVWKPLRSQSWHITIHDRDDFGLEVGENVFGALSKEKAVDLANRIAARTDLPVNVPSDRITSP
jgi:hypothetical protein